MTDPKLTLLELIEGGWSLGYEPTFSADWLPEKAEFPQVARLNAALKMIEDRGGREWYFDFYRRRNEMIRSGVEGLGLGTYPMKGYESPTVSCVTAPESMSGPDVYGAMRGRGFELAQGYGALKESTFRIGNMGWMPEGYIVEVLEALEEVA